MQELEETVKNILEAKPRRIYVFMNNNHYMIANARTILKMFQEYLNQS
jgi:uncharacterized protein YecE (DUF72 family)